MQQFIFLIKFIQMSPSRRFFFFSIFLLTLYSCVKHSQRIPLKGIISEKAMVSSAHPLASAIGLETMKKGGNTIDAAIATHFALSVVYPQWQHRWWWFCSDSIG